MFINLFIKNKAFIFLINLSLFINLYTIYTGQIVFNNHFQKNSLSDIFNDGIKVLAFNIWKDNPDQTKIVTLIYDLDPDIVWLQEIKINYYHQIYGDLAKKYPFSYPEKNKVSIQGNIFLSKFPFEVKKIDPSFKSSLLHTKITIGKQKLHFFGVHLVSPRNQHRLETRRNQFAYVADYIQKQTHLSESIIVAGDMNTVYWNPVLKNFREKTRLNHYRKISDIMPTWPSYLPELFQIPLDYIMTSPDICLDNQIKADMTGSDHYPLFYNLYFCC